MNIVTNLPQISCSSVFPDESAEGLNQAITLLSTSLAPFRDGPSSRAVFHPRQDADKLLYLQDFDRFSTLVTTGDRADKAANVVNAVTGHIAPQGVQAAIVSRNTKGPHNLAIAASGPFSFVEVAPSDRKAAATLLTRWRTTPQASFAQHVQDVVTIISFLAQLLRSHEIEPKVVERAVDYFAAFVHMRAIYKLRARVANGSRCWGKSPVAIIVDEIKRLLGDANYFPTKSTIELSAAEANLITRAGIDPYPNTTRFVLDTASLPSWLSLLEKTYGIIDDETSAASDPKTPSVVSAHVEKIIVAMPTFEVLVKHLVPAIVSDSVARRLRTLYDDKRSEVSGKVDKKFSDALVTIKKSHTTPEGSAQQSTASLGKDESKSWTGTASQIGGEDHDDTVAEENDDEELVHPEGDEDGGSHVVRYLKTIYAWWDAASHIADRIPEGATLRVAHVFVNDVSEKHINETRIVDFVQQYVRALDTYEHRARAVAFFCVNGFATPLDGPEDEEGMPPFGPPSAQKLEQLQKRPSIHAEAALMGLACLQRSGERASDLPIVKEVFQAKPTVIGVSKKCCRCCWLLSQLLEEDGTEPGSSVNSFFLPGTHARLYPWIPPPGIPLHILRQLRQRLFNILVRVTYTLETGLRSTQTSPALSQGEQERVPISEQRFDDVPQLDQELERFASAM